MVTIRHPGGIPIGEQLYAQMEPLLLRVYQEATRQAVNELQMMHARNCKTRDSQAQRTRRIEINRVVEKLCREAGIDTPAWARE